MYSKVLKRTLDISLVLCLLLILTPLLLILFILIKSTSEGPVLFKQKRVGKDGNIFMLLKFRSMTNEKHEIKRYVKKEAGVTWIGYYLRKYKMDELPQLINVLKGEMSLVGPRPSVPEHLENMNRRQLKRFLIRPGMTGLAQVSGNIYLEWSERFEYDLTYTQNISFFNDLKILWRTVLVVMLGEEFFFDKPLILK